MKYTIHAEIDVEEGIDGAQVSADLFQAIADHIANESGVTVSGFSSYAQKEVVYDEDDCPDETPSEVLESSESGS